MIGAGITGLTAADLLKRNGKTVAVVDLARIGTGETSHTSAHLTEVTDIGYADLISKFGVDGARLAALSMREAIAQIEENVKAYGIECDFARVSAFQFTEKKEEVARLDEQLAAALRLGVAGALAPETPLPLKRRAPFASIDRRNLNPSRT